MKKHLLTGFSILIVFTLLFATTGSASAAPLADGPSIYSSTDDSVTATILEIDELPGTVKLDNGAIYPVGFESGSRVFSGQGLQVSGLNGSAVIHMTVKNFTYGWTGSIYQYFGNGWIEVPTVITKDNESNDGTASATIYYDGIYAVLVRYVAPIVNETGPECPVYESIAYFFLDMDEQLLGPALFIAQGDFTDLGLTYGMEVDWTIRSINPAVSFSGATSGTAPLYLMEDGDYIYGFVVQLSTSMEDLPIVEFSGEGVPYFFITVDTGACNFSYTADEETFEPTSGY
jgi:hypothetical protein